MHKGKDPVVEIEILRNVEKLIFQCDFGRQEFLQALVKIKGKANAKDSYNSS